MIRGGNVTVIVSDMERAVRFYTETLGFRLKERYGDQWASVEVGNGLTIGLHPMWEGVQARNAGEKPTADRPREDGAGRTSAGQQKTARMMIGLQVDEPIERVVEALSAHGVVFEGRVQNDTGGSFASFADPDGNELYLWKSA